MARRQWRWAGDSNSMAVTAGSTQSVEVLDESVLEKGETIVRVVGQVSANLTSVSSANRINAIGLMLLPSQATNGPNPLTDFDADWIWHSLLIMMPQVEVADFQTRHLFVDNRSMRKVGSDERLMMMGHAVTSTANLAWGIRIGLKMA